MRVVVISFACLLVALIVWFCFFYFSIETTLEDFNLRFDKISDSITYINWNDAVIETDNMINKWEKIKKHWEYFVHQDDLDEISASLLKMKRAIENHDKTLSLMQVEDLKIFFERIKGNESLTLENIF